MNQRLTTIDKLFLRIQHFGIISFLLLVIYSSGLARQPLILKKMPDSVIFLAQYAEIYVDSVAPQSLEQVQAAWRVGKFIPMEEFVYPPKFESGKYHYWFRFELENHTNDTLDIRLKLSRLDSVFYYEYTEGKLTREALFGHLLSLDSIQNLGLEMFSNTTLPVQYAPGQRYEIWIRAMDHLYLTGRFNLSLMSPYQFLYKSTSFYLKLATIECFFLGILFFVMLFSLFQYFQNRDKAFLWYTFYTFTLFLYFWRAFDFDNPIIKPIHHLTSNWLYVKIPIDIAIYITYALFVKYFVDEKRQYKRLANFIRGSLIGLFIYLALTITISLFSIRWAWIIHYFLRIGLSLIMLGFILELSRIKTSLAKYIIVGSGMLLVFSLLAPTIMSMRTKGFYWGEIDITLLISRGGVLVELLCFSLGLGYKNKIAQKEKIQAEHEAERIRSLNQLKDQLYTNITHEFRTPLTIISGMANQIEEEPDMWLGEGVDMIKRNSLTLLNMVNQMLDLRKLEMGNLPINMIQDDIIGYLRYVTESFQSFAASKNIQLIFNSQEDKLYMDYDPEKMLNIVSNLLSNAINYTSEGGNVELKVRNGQLAVGSGQLALSNELLNQLPTTNSPTANCLLLTIKDTGIGISPEQLPHIFDRFYQVEDTPTRKEGGSGIGLAFVRELVNLLKGEISVESTLGEGTSFLIILPIRNEAPDVENKDVHTIKKQVNSFIPSHSSLDKGTSQEGTIRNIPLALIIEDNKDVQQYLQICLEPNYRLGFAENGREGVEKALELIPDIIISDVMMPYKDGFEVCKELKTDRRTSHIPIILLTAKTDFESRVKGLQKGADAYLAKPFEKKELEVRLQQLILLRKKLQERYASIEILDKKESEVSHEDKFIQQVQEVVLQHLDNSKLDVSMMCEALGMSRTQLHRKISALTNRSTTSFIRFVRLQKAKKLLENPEFNVSQVAYAVGFSDAGYFSRMFIKEYGYAPSEMKND